ncbi:MAG: VOC family protein [Acidimicrobiales bacterium]
MGVKELGHVVLYVENAERSARFYREVLGWHQIMPEDGIRVERTAAFSGGRTHHELLLIEVGSGATPIPGGRRLGMYHFGLRVGDTDEDLKAAYERVVAAGATVLGASDHTVTHSLYIADPDGNEVELYIDVPGIDWERDASLMASPIKPLLI